MAAPICRSGTFLVLFGFRKREFTVGSLPFFAAAGSLGPRFDPGFGKFAQIEKLTKVLGCPKS